MITILIRYSNRKRNQIEQQRAKKLLTKQVSLMELTIFNFVPIVISSTILAPLNRLKLIFQLQPYHKDAIPFQKLTSKEIMSSKIKL
jgi:hypothetical protein